MLFHDVNIKGCAGLKILSTYRTVESRFCMLLHDVITKGCTKFENLSTYRPVESRSG